MRPDVLGRHRWHSCSHSVGRSSGGLVDERLRWCARLGLSGLPVVGYLAGLRQLAKWPGGASGCSHRRRCCAGSGCTAGDAYASVLIFTTPTSGTGICSDEARATWSSCSWSSQYWAGFDYREFGLACVQRLACGRPYRLPERSGSTGLSRPDAWTTHRCAALGLGLGLHQSCKTFQRGTGNRKLARVELVNVDPA